MEYRDLQLARCERVIRSIWSMVLAGNLGAVDRVVKVLAREAKLLGLDEPTRVEVKAETKEGILQALDAIDAMMAIPDGYDLPDESELADDEPDLPE
jgi:hypothetical protein